ncbi:MAG: CocE/NonD family hydrolase [Acidobacteria bacterium]|nr:CocE/NonD family hydrolase [Acidobacteriota bacterium]
MKQARNLIFLLIAFIFFVYGGFAPAAFAQQTPVSAEQTAVRIDPAVFDAYVGQYENRENLPGMVFSFFRQGDKFYGQMTGQEQFEIFPKSETAFFLKVVPAEVEFVRDAAGGKASSVVLRQNGRTLAFKRTADQPAKNTNVAYVRADEMIPMRDGTKLHTVILTPEKSGEALPILMSRTPYGVDGLTSSRINAGQPEFVKDGYIFVFQDIRGTHGSEGDFLMNRPLRDKKDAKSVDESTDTYDTIDWLVKNVKNNNGRVGIFGVSYPGWLAAVALVDPHPALKASSPQAPMVDTWMGDDFFHNGAFRQAYGHEYVFSMEPTKQGRDVSFGKEDAYDWYLSKKTLAAVTDYLGGRLPTWNNFVAHPAYDEFWQARAADLYIKHATVPTMIVGGWWDQEDMYGPLALYKALEKTDKENIVTLVMGPWNHGGWNRPGNRLGAVDFGEDPSKYFREKIQAPWFAYYLKGSPKPNHAEATVFQSGRNQWMSYDAWPPKTGVAPAEIYMQSGGKVSFVKPSKSDTQFDSYVSDPANPVPYRKRPIEATYDPNGSGWRTWLVQDQRFLEGRPDTLRWSSDVLDRETTITGDVVAHLFASTSGSDSDWIVKLIDVYPADDARPGMAGYQLMVAEEIFRGRYRKSFSKPEAIAPDKVEEYTVDLRGNNYTFLKGHRIMVEVQSTWFPLYDRNPQKFVPNIFLAAAGDYVMATQKIYRTPEYPSHISVTLAK